MKLQGSQILPRLMKHFAEDLELTDSQVQVGLALLRKYLPDIKEHRISGELTMRTVPREMSDEDILRELEHLTIKREKGAPKLHKKTAAGGRPVLPRRKADPKVKKPKPPGPRKR